VRGIFRATKDLYYPRTFLLVRLPGFRLGLVCTGSKQMSTHKVSVREARGGLRRLLDQVQAGDEVVVLRRGAEVARLVRPKRTSPPLPDLGSFRASVKRRGRPLSQDLWEARRSSRC
jgi:prevent-host-death family protein